MLEPDFARIADLIADRGRVRADDAVLICAHDEAMPLAEELTLACLRREAVPMTLTQWDDINVRALREAPLSALAKTPRHFAALIENADAIFLLSSQMKNPALLAPVPGERLAAAARGKAPINDVLFDGRRRIIITDFPTRPQAALYGVDYVSYHDTFWKALDIDYDALTDRVSCVKNFIEGRDIVHIQSDKGTDVRLRIGGRPVDVDDGVVGVPGESGGAAILNLPTGEVCLAPWEDGAEGRVVFDFAFIAGVRVRDLEVEFSGGQAAIRGAREGGDRARAFFGAATGNPYGIAELGIGLNPAITRPCGSILMDEKIMGTVHIALGDNRALGGSNVSSVHQDMIILRPRVTCDGEPLIADGRILPLPRN